MPDKPGSGLVQDDGIAAYVVVAAECHTCDYHRDNLSVDILRKRYDTLTNETL
jgi:hypothetical protein